MQFTGFSIFHALLVKGDPIRIVISFENGRLFDFYMKCR